MSVKSEIERINNNIKNIRAALGRKGITATNHNTNDFASDIDAILDIDSADKTEPTKTTLNCGEISEIPAGYLTKKYTITAKDLASQTPGKLKPNFVYDGFNGWANGERIYGNFPIKIMRNMQYTIVGSTMEIDEIPSDDVERYAYLLVFHNTMSDPLVVGFLGSVLYIPSITKDPYVHNMTAAKQGEVIYYKRNKNFEILPLKHTRADYPLISFQEYTDSSDVKYSKVYLTITTGASVSDWVVRSENYFYPENNGATYYPYAYFSYYRIPLSDPSRYNE